MERVILCHHLQLTKFKTKKLARKTKVAKLNIGTEIRMTFGEALRKNLKNNPKTYDRLQLKT